MRALPARALARRLAGLAAISTLVALGLTTGTASAASTPLPTAVFAKTSDWGTGFSASYTITNAMSVTLNNWAVSFTLPATEKVTSLWDGTLTTSGNTYTATNASYNAPLAPGATATFGFNASVSGTEANPAACTLNGNPCDGSADPIAPTAPGGLAVLSTTANAVSMSWLASHQPPKAGFQVSAEPSSRKMRRGFGSVLRINPGY